MTWRCFEGEEGGTGKCRTRVNARDGPCREAREREREKAIATTNYLHSPDKCTIN